MPTGRIRKRLAAVTRAVAALIAELRVQVDLALRGVLLDKVGVRLPGACSRSRRNDAGTAAPEDFGVDAVGNALKAGDEVIDAGFAPLRHSLPALSRTRTSRLALSPMTVTSPQMT